MAYNQLAYSYQGLNDLDNAIKAIETYIELAPDEANPHDTKGSIYALFGEFDKAIEAFEDALRINPDFPYSIQQLAHMHLLKDSLEKADSLYDKATTLGDIRVRIWSHVSRAQVLIRAGKLDASLNMINTIKNIAVLIFFVFLLIVIGIYEIRKFYEEQRKPQEEVELEVKEIFPSAPTTKEPDQIIGEVVEIEHSYTNISDEEDTNDKLNSKSGENYTY